MWQYNNEELYHYGVPGMKWGVRRSQRRLAKLTGRKPSQVSQKEAENFHKDLRYAKKMKGVETRTDSKGNLKVLNRHGQMTKTQYGQALVKAYKQEMGKKTVKAVAGTAAAATGAWVAANMIKTAALVIKRQGEVLESMRLWG